MVTTPDGSPVAMVHCNNCTSDINAWIHLFGEFASAAGLDISNDKLYTLMFNQAGMGDAGCGGLISYNCYSGEPVLGLNEGCPMFIHNARARLICLTLCGLIYIQPLRHLKAAWISFLMKKI